MKDGQIVWQVQCQHCGWKDPDYGTDIDVGKVHAAEHLATVHGIVFHYLSGEEEDTESDEG